ncbi:MAG: PEP-CTERM sorting domain-containing protein [Pseudomonadota bacterium]
MKKKFLEGLLITLISIGVHSLAMGEIVGPVWPAPGGTNWVFSGDIGRTGGLTINYSGLDTAKFENLYWGPWQGAPIAASLNGGSYESNEIMNPISISGNVAFWMGTSYLNVVGTYSGYCNTRFTMTVSDGSTNPIYLINPNPLGLSGVNVLAPVDGNFSVNLLFEALFPIGGWQPLNTGFDQLHTTSTTASNFSGGFYYTPAATVPVPSTIFLLGAGLVGLAGVARKKMKK